MIKKNNKKYVANAIDLIDLVFIFFNEIIFGNMYIKKSKSENGIRASLNFRSLSKFLIMDFEVIKDRSKMEIDIIKRKAVLSILFACFIFKSGLVFLVSRDCILLMLKVISTIVIEIKINAGTGMNP